jgi:hypothetical protein
MHGLADFVFGKADLCRVFHIERVARHEKIKGDLLLLRHEFQRGKPSATGYDLELALGVGFDLQVLQQAVRCNAGGKRLDAVHWVGLAHIVG